MTQVPIPTRAIPLNFNIVSFGRDARVVFFRTPPTTSPEERSEVTIVTAHGT